MVESNYRSEALMFCTFIRSRITVATPRLHYAKGVIYMRSLGALFPHHPIYLRYAYITHLLKMWNLITLRCSYWEVARILRTSVTKIISVKDVRNRGVRVTRKITTNINQVCGSSPSGARGIHGRVFMVKFVE